MKIKSRITSIVVIAATIAFAFCLAACGSQTGTGQAKSYVKVDGQEYTLDEWQNTIYENEIAAEAYKGKEAEVVSPVESIKMDTFSLQTGSNGYRQFSCKNGYVSLEGGWKIEVTDENAELAANLKAGDLVKATGKIWGFDIYSGVGGRVAITGLVNSDGYTNQIEKV